MAKSSNTINFRMPRSTLGELTARLGLAGVVPIPAEALRLIRLAAQRIGDFHSDLREKAPAALTCDLAEGLEPLLHALELVDAAPTAAELDEQARDKE